MIHIYVILLMKDSCLHLIIDGILIDWLYVSIYNIFYSMGVLACILGGILHEYEFMFVIVLVSCACVLVCIHVNDEA